MSNFCDSVAYIDALVLNFLRCLSIYTVHRTVWPPFFVIPEPVCSPQIFCSSVLRYQVNTGTGTTR